MPHNVILKCKTCAGRVPKALNFCSPACFYKHENSGRAFIPPYQSPAPGEPYTPAPALPDVTIKKFTVSKKIINLIAQLKKNKQVFLEQNGKRIIFQRGG